VEHTVDWKTGVLASELAQPGVTHVGSCWTEQRQASYGVSEEWLLEIAACQPNHELGSVGRCGQLRVDECFSLQRWDGGDTRLTLTMETSGAVRPVPTTRTIVEMLVHLDWELEGIGKHSKVRPER